ncbi:response regulator transcription factor [Tenggerimyces flavus]|uniref:Response regulator n=1 Tax=Tenggerimyces flavus TaxID=1708749 RepID=A0ABV7YI97_9ACTN|nr:response regulator transcription factor [Tenggerimyces flavus]MBM7787486.1 two-component system response regulator DesR [Tenggerimyces flavus]
MIRIVVADDQHMVRGALAALLSLEPDLEVVAEAENGVAAVAAVAEHLPDIALLDIEMPDMDGITVAAKIRELAPSTRVLILTTFGRPGYLRRAMDSGVQGFVVKDARAPELATSVRRVHNGEVVLDPALAVASLSRGPNPLTSREGDVLRASADGHTTAEIAERLSLSKGTVRNYLSSAIAKCAARNRQEAARTALERGWL